MVTKGENDFSQIDLVLATKQGIVVFEVKDYKGWLFGAGNHNNWTQVLAYRRRKYRFYNPIKQKSYCQLKTYIEFFLFRLSNIYA